MIFGTKADVPWARNVKCNRKLRFHTNHILKGNVLENRVYVRIVRETGRNNNSHISSVSEMTAT